MNPSRNSFQEKEHRNLIQIAINFDSKLMSPSQLHNPHLKTPPFGLSAQKCDATSSEKRNKNENSTQLVAQSLLKSMLPSQPHPQQGCLFKQFLDIDGEWFAVEVRLEIVSTLSIVQGKKCLIILHLHPDCFLTASVDADCWRECGFPPSFGMTSRVHLSVHLPIEIHRKMELEPLDHCRKWTNDE